MSGDEGNVVNVWKRAVAWSFFLSSVAGTLGVAQSIEPANETRLSYLGFYAGMSVAELLAAVTRRDKSPFDINVFCRPAYQPKSAADRTCYFPSATHRQSGLRLESLSFAINDSGPVNYINISVETTTPKAGALELERIVHEWQSAGHTVTRSALGGFVGSRRVEGCGAFGWIDEQVVRHKVQVSCVPMIVGDRPQLWVTLHHRSSR